MIITLNFTVQELAVLEQGLSLLPYRDVVNLFTTINSQIQTQVSLKEGTDEKIDQPGPM